MSREMSEGDPLADVRGRGFADRVPLATATAWVDAVAVPQAEEPVDAAMAAGRVLAAPISAPADLPAQDRAQIDGYGLRAARTVGAGDYNPLRLALAAPGDILAPGAAMPLAAGVLLPDGADAVLPFAAAQLAGDAIEVFAAVAEGAGVERRGWQGRAGTPLLAAGRVLAAAELGLLAALGAKRVRVLRRPRVAIVTAGPKTAGPKTAGPKTAGSKTAGSKSAAPRSAGAGNADDGDADRAMLQSLIARDGGVVTAMRMAEDQAAIARAILEAEADLVLVAGRSGTGLDDGAPPAVAMIGTLAIHGVALEPGGSVGLGQVGSLPVLLLPGEPTACLAAYELLAGRLIRRFGGRDPALPHRRRPVEIGRKLVSMIGVVELCPLRLVAGRAEPAGSGLVALARADGFVLVPAALEGYPPGAQVTLHLFAGTSDG
jgi:molybdopterin molybdotransferase